MKIKPVPAAAAAAAVYFAPKIVAVVGAKVAGGFRNNFTGEGVSGETQYAAWMADNAWINPVSRLALGLGTYYLVGKFA